MFRPFAALIVATVAGPMVAAAEPGADRGRHPAESEQTRKRLAEAEQKLAAKPADAVDDLQKILDEAGDDLILVDGKHLVPARLLVHRFLARLPAAALGTYRDRVDEPARKLLDAGTQTRDPRPLRVLLAKFFCARPAEDALFLLGELAFERGEFREAEAHWQRLLPDTPADDLPFPDPRKERRADVAARVVLAEIFQGDHDRAAADLARFAKEFPDARGRLAGADGPFAETLRKRLANPPVLPPEISGEGDWPTFAGAAARTGAVTGRFPLYWPARPTWKSPIPTDKLPKVPRPVASARSVGFHPVVLNGAVYIADNARVLAFDTLTGKSAVAFELPADGANRQPDAEALPLPADADFTLTAADGKLFARLGSTAVVAPPLDVFGQVPTTSSYLVGLTPAGPRLKLAWKLAPPVPNGTAAAWEGAPVVAGGRVFAAFAKFDGTRVTHAVAGFDDPPGRPLWVADVSDAPLAAFPENRPRQELLTLAGGSVVFCPNAGVIAAVDAATGKPAWAFRYPPAERTPSTTGPRDLCPPVFADGRVFVAPTDADRIYAFDALTGKLLWDAGPVFTDQLLGVVRGKLVVTVAGPNRGVRALDVRTGRHREPDGWATHDDPFLSSFGRGLVSDDLVLWPTKSGVFLLSPADGTALRPPLPGPHGNLAFAGGVLLVATPTEVWGYVADRRQLFERKKFADARPADPDAAENLGLALADAGRFAEAEAALAGTDAAVRRKAEWLADAGERAVARGDRDAAKSAWRELTAGPFPETVRARAAGRLRQLDAAAEIPAELRNSWVLGVAGVPTRVGEIGRPPPTASPEKVRVPPPADPVNRPGLGYDARIDRETRFPSARCVPLLPFPGEVELPGLGVRVPAGDRRLIVTDGEKLFAFRPPGEVRDEKPAWDAPLPAGLFATHGATDGATLFAAGPRGVAAFRLRDGKPAWHVLVPETDPLPAAGGRPVPWASGQPPAFPGLSGFVLAGDRVVARLGPHHLIAFDVTAGRVAWVLDAAKRQRFTPFAADPDPRFSPGFAVAGGVVVAHISRGSPFPQAVGAAGSGGRRLGIAVATGEVKADLPSSAAPWDSPPAVLGPGRAAVAVGPGTVRAVESDRRFGDWPYDAGGEASLTGKSPAVRLFGDWLAVAVFRNHGVEIARIGPATGRVLWGDQSAPSAREKGPTRECTAFIPAGDLDLALADADGANLYLPADGKLTAVRIEDGREAWVADLGEGLWAVRAGRRAVIAVPVEPAAEEPIATVAGRAVRRFAESPAVARLPGLAVGLYDAWADRTFPLVFVDPDTGRVRHRLVLPAGPVAAAHLGGGVAVVATAGKAFWLK